MGVILSVGILNLGILYGGILSKNQKKNSVSNSANLALYYSCYILKCYLYNYSVYVFSAFFVYLFNLVNMFYLICLYLLNC